MVKTNTLGALAAAAGVLVAVGLLMLLMSEPHPAGAILLPGLRGKIAYQGYDGHDREIYTINPGGWGKFNVTNNNTDDENPAYSPSGKKIAYSGYDGNDWEIYTINAGGGGGGGRVRLTDNSTNDFAPSWRNRHDADDSEDADNNDDD
jgi:WD40-like Beta Propeller Repeat